MKTVKLFYNNKLIASRKFYGAKDLNVILNMWKKIYADKYYEADVVVHYECRERPKKYGKRKKDLEYIW